MCVLALRASFEKLKKKIERFKNLGKKDLKD
jgi:hypothetical protein